MSAPSSPRWTGACYQCHREREIESRFSHAEKALCDECAALPHRPPRVSDDEFRALNGALSPGGSSAPVGAARGARRIETTDAGSIPARIVRWAWRDWVALRSLSVLAGERGLGKSTFTAWLAARVTRGELGGELEGRPRDVLLLSAEDDWESVIVPRAMAAGADLARIHRVAVRTDDDGEGLFTLPDDIKLLEGTIGRLREQGHPVALVIVDPIGAYLSASTDTHREAPMRRALAPLAEMSMRCDLVALAVAHLTKAEGASLLARVSGAGAFTNAPRSVLGFAKDPDDQEGRQRVIAHLKSNWGELATSLAAVVESTLVEVEDGTADVGRLIITGETSIGAEDLRGGSVTDVQDTEEAIVAALADGPHPSREVKAQVAKELGCSTRSVIRAARRMEERQELTIEKSGYPPTTTWALAAAPDSGSSLVTRAVSPTVMSPRVTNGKPRIPKPNPGGLALVSDTDTVRVTNGVAVTNGEPFGGCSDHAGHRHLWRPDPLLPGRVSCATCVPFGGDGGVA